MDALIHECSTTVQSKGAAPSAAVVVLLSAPPFHECVAVSQSAEPAFLDGLFQGDVRGTESRRQNRTQLDVVVAARLDDAVATFERDFQRLLDHDMFASLGRFDSGFHVGAARCADRDDPNGRVSQHVLQVVVHPTPGVLAELVRSRTETVKTPHDFSAADVFDGLRVKPRNHPTADDPESGLHNGLPEVSGDFRTDRRDVTPQLLA